MGTRMFASPFLVSNQSFASLIIFFQTFLFNELLLHKFSVHSMVLKWAYYMPLAKLLFLSFFFFYTTNPWQKIHF